MAATHYRTLVIETGILCNNRCVFCYQRGYRALPGYPKLVPGEEVRERMRWGLANGFDEVSLTGGEPTVRPDFLELVRYAREIGYRRMAITTNGWRLASPDFFQEACAAGLTSLGVSIHGPTAEIHDAAGRDAQAAGADEVVPAGADVDPAAAVDGDRIGHGNHARGGDGAAGIDRHQAAAQRRAGGG